jgi:hypothetical protein
MIYLPTARQYEIRLALRIRLEGESYCTHQCAVKMSWVPRVRLLIAPNCGSAGKADLGESLKY